MESNIKSVIFKTSLGVFNVTEEQIRKAMDVFDVRFRSCEDDSGTLYAVLEKEKRYPPKRILEIATGVPRNKFYGGKPSNNVFWQLGFQITESDASREKSIEEIVKELARLAEPIPDVSQLLDSLFCKTWSRLDDDSVLIDSHYPGVYVLAYPDEQLLKHPVIEDLSGQPLSEEQIFYVGMSHAGVRKRLRQFTDGLEDGGHHSGAKKFFAKVAKGIPFSAFPARKTFFVASISIPCTYLKTERHAMDLMKMGVVAQLEWYVLGRVKEKTEQFAPCWQEIWIGWAAAE